MVKEHSEYRILKRDLEALPISPFNMTSSVTNALLFAFLVFIASAAPSTPTCPKKEVYDANFCPGCDNSCDEALPTPCANVCEKRGGCRCFRCPPLQCGENEEFDFCGGCEGSCQKPGPFCVPSCAIRRCVCVHGFLRNDDGKCIPAADCPKKALP
ncbi:hypothetical protein QR680_013799 [Steinernema hermaphroditum]|uniref:TIL domain-containing protein n=1 Tax=Steinernema hermaphroditum TaxID=289476 RepID=A0AA39I6Q3_9BILA|nr:hypothetical protein QR680_013799 [Steinernema hermaphroditum]